MANSVLVFIVSAIEGMEVRQAISSAQALVATVKRDLFESEMLKTLGVDVLDLSIIAITPTPEMARALDASKREEVLQEADEAIYRRRNASIEQERAVKENELNTELAVEQKQRQIKGEKLKAERSLAEQRRAMSKEKLEADIENEERKQSLVELATQHERSQADAKAHEIAVTMEALSKVDHKVLEAMTMSNLNPQQLMAQAFRELAGSAEKIGQLNIAPDLLKSLAEGMPS